MSRLPWNLTDVEANELAHAIVDFQRNLPGWWWSVGNCHVSADASCAPDRVGPDAWLLQIEKDGHHPFDEGFHLDARFDEGERPSVAKSLRAVMLEAIEARAAAVAARGTK